MHARMHTHNTHTHTRTHTRTHAHTHTHTHACTHAHSHTHTYTHILTGRAEHAAVLQLILQQVDGRPVTAHQAERDTGHMQDAYRDDCRGGLEFVAQMYTC